MKLNSAGIENGWPRLLSQTIFRELPSNLDAALFWPTSNKGPARTYFFKVCDLSQTKRHLYNLWHLVAENTHCTCTHIDILDASENIIPP